MRQALDARAISEPIRWIPDRSSVWRWGRALYLAAVAVVLVGGGAVLIATHPGADSDRSMLAAMPSPRLEQIVAAVHPSFEQAIEPVKSEPEALVLMTAYLIEMQAGRRARLAAHVANDAVMQPETVAVVKGVPKDIRLSEGIMIGPGLWMLRPDLLPSAELDAAITASGRHELTIELRTPEGTIVATGRTVLAIAPAAREEDKPVAVVPKSFVPVDEPVRSKTVKPAAAPVKTAVPNGTPVRRAAPKKVRTVAAPIEQDRDDDAVRPARKRKAEATRPARERRSTQSRVTVLSAGPAVPRPLQPPRLVWPGDDPRSQAYAPDPPSFLGGVVPGSVPQARSSASDADVSWRRRAFRR